MAKDIFRQFHVSVPRLSREYAEELLRKPGMPVADLPGLVPDDEYGECGNEWATFCDYCGGEYAADRMLRALKDRAGIV